MGHAAAEHEARGAREADAELHRTRGPFLDRVIDVDQVVGAGHRLRVDFDRLDEGQTLQAYARALDRALGERRGLKLAHLATQGFIIGAAVPAETDVMDVGALARLHEVVERDLARLVLDFRNRRDFGEGVAHVRQCGLDPVGALGGLLARESLTSIGRGQILEKLLVEYRIARETSVFDRIDLPLVDVDRDVDFLLVRRQRDLNGQNFELEITTILIIGLQRFQIARQLLLGIAVGALERHPVGAVQLELLQQFLTRKCRRTHDVDLLDLGDLAFGDLDFDLDAVVALLDDLGIDCDVVIAVGVVLTTQLLTDTIEQRALEQLALGEPELAQGLIEFVAADLFIAGDLERGDRRTFLHIDDQRVALAAQRYVLKQAGTVERAHRLPGGLLVELVADLNRQIGQHRAQVETRQAFGANVSDREGAERLGTRRQHRQANQDEQEETTQRARCRSRRRNTLH